MLTLQKQMNSPNTKESCQPEGKKILQIKMREDKGDPGSCNTLSRGGPAAKWDPSSPSSKQPEGQIAEYKDLVVYL